MNTRTWLVALLTVVAAGCGGNGPPRPDIWRGGSVPNVNANLVYRIQPGAGIGNVIPGVDVGYFITANIGNSFRLVWTGDAQNSGSRRHFQGSVYTTGVFTDKVEGCNGGLCLLEANDLVSTIATTAGGQRIDFDTFAADGLDGFDFVANTADPVFFDLLIEGQRRADLVFFPATDNGGQVSNSGGMPFGLIPQ